MPSPDALVVGAGPVGLTMACELARHGLTVRIIDENEGATDKSKALAIWSRTLEIFEVMGCQEAIDAGGNRGRAANLMADGNKLAHIGFDHLRSPFPWVLLLPQRDTERVLEEHLARTYGIKVERNTKLQTFDSSGEAVSSVLANSGETITTSWLLGCDGAHSAVRKRMGFQFDGTTNPSDWLLADLIVGKGALPEDEMSIHFSTAGVLAAFPFRGRGGIRYRIIADVGEHKKDAPRRPDPTLEEVSQVLQERAKITTEVSDPDWLTWFTINERKVKEYRQGRVFLAGDAAHIHSPAGGQGMNTGIQDAYNLAWKIAMVEHRQAHFKLLDSYSHERSAVGDMVLSNATLLTMMGTLRNPLAQGLRNQVLAFVGGLEIFQDRASANFGELNIAYAHSPLTREHGGAHAWLLRAGTHAGDRLPDGELLKTDGTPVRLFELLRNTRFNLFLLEGLDHQNDSPADLAGLANKVAQLYPDTVNCHFVGQAGLSDPEDRVHKELGAARPTVYLVRPDGYVGYRGQPAQEQPLLDYLQEFLVGKS